MSLLLNSVTVSDTTSKYFNSKVNILIDSKGIIKKISKNKISDKVKKVVDLEGLYISESWFDFNANFCDPGYEYKENLKNASSSLGAIVDASGQITETAKSMTNAQNDAVRLQKELQDLTENLSKLNKIYVGMYDAMHK